jgi:hypothetical protein
VYLLVTWTVSSLFYFLIIKSTGTNAANGAYTSGLMWCPPSEPCSLADVSDARSPAWVGSGAKPVTKLSAT